MDAWLRDYRGKVETRRIENVRMWENLWAARRTFRAAAERRRQSHMRELEAAQTFRMKAVRGTRIANTLGVVVGVAGMAVGLGAVAYAETKKRDATKWV